MSVGRVFGNSVGQADAMKGGVMSGEQGGATRSARGASVGGTIPFYKSRV